jgi:hypothetical protein
MRCKIFYSRSRRELEKAVNEWLETHMLVIEMPIRFSSVAIQDETEYILEHTIVLFYIPRAGEVPA